MVKRAPAPVTAYIALGSNQGDRRALMQQALDRLKETPGIEVKALSRWVETRPIGPQDQPDFLNAVARVETVLEPLRLLDRLQEIENALGRRRERHWGPRTMDLDILLYGDQRIDHPRLRVPHPEIGHRPFLQEALNELL